MSAAVTWTMLDTPQGIAVAASVVAAALAGGVIAMLRGYGRDPLERLAAVCAQLGLVYQATEADADATAGSVAGARVLARFVGEVGGLAEVEARGEAGAGAGGEVGGEAPGGIGPVVVVEVLGAARGGLPDGPPTRTVCSVAAHAPAVTIQPRAWVLGLDGRPARQAVRTGNADVDERWAVLPRDGGGAGAGADADAAASAASANASAAQGWLTEARVAALLALPAGADTAVVACGATVATVDPGVLDSRVALEARLRLLEALGA